MPSPVAAERIESRNAVWNAATARGGELASLALVGGVSWEWVATRGIIGTAVYCLAHRDGVAVANVGLDSLLFVLTDPVDYLRLVTTQLPEAGHDITAPETLRVPDDPNDAKGDADSDTDWDRDPVVAQWRWLNRRWPAEEDTDDQGLHVRVWDGLPRRMARGAHLPAIDVCVDWAANAVSRALAAERGALEHKTTVLVTGGPYAGLHGHIAGPNWSFDVLREIVEPGLPVTYRVILRPAHGSRILAPVLADHLATGDDESGGGGRES
jgi:hypothetical protein